MQKLNKKELLNIKGGGISLGVACLIGTGIIFLIGVIDGYTRPLKCNK
ncbi:MAG: class IIb bacteriocin, lactobin A/cerein 7B family [Mollicutes bacterium]|mgnify:CR=1 FL=1|nr:class IIb bacteriocin, lactobin A/cerein 7B family [Mollicutes bacterium]